MTSKPKEIDRFHWPADRLLFPHDGDWPVRNMAPFQQGGLGKGSDRVGWRAFDDTTEEGVGTEPFIIPDGTAEIAVESCIRARDEELTGGMCLGLYAKQLIRDGLDHRRALAVNKWGQWTPRIYRPVTKVDRLLRFDVWNLSPSALNLDVGEVGQLELIRAPRDASDSLVGDMALTSIDVVFYRA